jgi:hypothetical protein
VICLKSMPAGLASPACTVQKRGVLPANVDAGHSDPINEN